MAAPLLSIVVPCYNESENLRSGVLQELHDYVQAQPYACEVVISDDGSTDDSRELLMDIIATWPGFRLQENPHRGKPWAVWSGIIAARGEIVLFADMDQSTPIDQVERLLPCFDQGYDLAIGSRGRERTNFAWYRRLGSAAFLVLRRLLLLRSIRDTQCGFKALRREVALELFPKLEAIRDTEPARGWKVTAFDVELLYLAERVGYRIAEVPVKWADRDLAKGKGKSYVAESQEMARQILRIKINALKGFYDRASNEM
jgi:dolichyl-phosphate beta-glucosyltransferase